MALLTYIARGNEVEFSVTFDDVNGDPVVPDAATLYLSFMDEAGDRVSEDIEMDSNTDGSVWTALWDSSSADAGRVHWAVLAINPSAAQEGHFELTANLANPDSVTV